MILEYLSKAGKYIYNNRILMIICTLVVFIMTANLLKFISNLNTEHFDNQNENENENSPLKEEDKKALSGFMANQLKNMKNTDAK